ncbi:MAG: PEP-CTERM sorting domain-containing protein [Verrucomicrobia bacterium]|nr:PEP-CTERM sorting domain-containing protein [Verrucomicrobiota bacterium]
MKNFLLLSCLVLLDTLAFGQGQVSINTAAAGAYMRFGLTSDPQSTTFEWCSGSLYRAGLYWADNPATLSAGGGTLVSSGGTNNTGLAVFTTSVPGFISSLTFGGVRWIPERAGQLTYFQLRVWRAGYATWADAYHNGDSQTAYTRVASVCAPPIVAATPTVDSLEPPPQILWAPDSTGQNPLVVPVLYWYAPPCVPEPATTLLAGLALLSLCFVRRRKP